MDGYTTFHLSTVHGYWVVLNVWLSGIKLLWIPMNTFFIQYSKGMLNLENPKELSKVVVPFFFPQKFIPILVFLHFCQFLILSVLLLKCQITPILTILTSLKLHCNFNFIFLMINDVEYLFMSFLTICIIYHMKC